MGWESVPRGQKMRFGRAWEDYRRFRVVSEHAARTIKNFLLAQVHVSEKVDAENEGDSLKEKRIREPLST